MTEEMARFLLSPDGAALLAEADALRGEKAETLRALTRLRKRGTPEQAQSAWEMADLRARGRAKFGVDAARMLFVREALEQASGAGVAAYHARRYAGAGVRTVADLGGGIGGDALAFARAGLAVTLYERDPVRALFAGENARALGLGGLVTVRGADILTADIGAGTVWLDPARREGRRRVTDPEEYAPPLSWLDTLKARGIGDVGVKLAPAIDHAVAAQYVCELEFLSEGGECREALLWRGALQTGDALRATVLSEDGDGPQTLAGEADDPRRFVPPASGRYLYEPDPAVIRAHLVGTLGAGIDAAPVDPQIAYLLGDTLHHTPFADAYEVLDRFPYGRKRLQDALAARDVGHVVIKKRGFPQEPDAVRRQLKLRGSAEMIVVLARVGAGHDAFLCRLLPKAGTPCPVPR